MPLRGPGPAPAPGDTSETPPVEAPDQLLSGSGDAEEQGRAGADLKQRTMRAIKWSYFSMAAGIALQLVFAAVLSRLLTKEQFGIVASAALLQRFGQFMADLGVGQALVQKAQLTDDDVAAALTSSVVLGSVATVLAWILAPYAGEYFKSPELVPVFRGYATIYVLTGCVVVASSLLRRELKFRPLVIAELTGYVLGHGLLGLGSAALGYGAMSLVISAFAQGAIQLAILYGFSRHSLRLTFRREHYRHIYSFGTQATVVNFLEFISNGLDTFLLTKFFSSAARGTYTRTYSTLAVPATSFGNSLTRVLAPSFSAVQNDPPRLRRAYLSGLQALSLIIFTAVGCVVVAAPEVVGVMLGPQFKDAVTLMQIFAFFVPFTVLTNLSAVLAEATARLKAKILIQLAYFALLLAGYLLAYRHGYGIEGFAAVLTGAAALRSLAFAALARSIVQGSGWQIARAYLVGLLVSAGAAALTWAVVTPLRPLLPLPALFLIEGLLGGLLLLAVILLGPDNELQRTARGVLGRFWPRQRGGKAPHP